MVLTIDNVGNNQAYFPPLPEKGEDNLITLEKIKSLIRYIQEKIWAFGKEVARLFVSALHIISNCEVSDSINGIPSTVSNMALTINRKINLLGFLSFVKAAICALHAIFKIEEAVDKGLNNDVEGTVFASLDVVASTIEALYDVDVGLVALSKLGVIAFNITFCLLAVPFAIIPLIYNICKQIYFMVRQLQFIDSIPNEGLKNSLDQQLDSKMILESHSDEKVVKLMKEMRKHLNSDRVDQVKIEAAKEHIKNYMWRKIGVEAVGALIDTAMLVTLVASIFFPAIPSALVHVMGGIKTAQSIARKVLYLLLHRWDNNNVPQFNPN
jgi:hypothetical protein